MWVFDQLKASCGIGNEWQLHCVVHGRRSERSHGYDGGWLLPGRRELNDQGSAVASRSSLDGCQQPYSLEYRILSLGICRRGWCSYGPVRLVVDLVLKAPQPKNSMFRLPIVSPCTPRLDIFGYPAGAICRCCCEVSRTLDRRTTDFVSRDQSSPSVS